MLSINTLTHTTILGAHLQLLIPHEKSMFFGYKMPSEKVVIFFRHLTITPAKNTKIYVFWKKKNLYLGSSPIVHFSQTLSN